MRAIIQRRYGGPDELTVEDAPRPSAGPGQVVVAVRAASVNADVWHMVHGLPRAARLFGGGLRRPKHPIPGIDLAGVVDEVGPDVTGLAVGDEVYGETVPIQWRNGGAYAEFAAVDADRLEPKPANLGFAEAATVPSTGGIAVSVTYDTAQVEAGHRVVVNGAAGGVGAFALQLAKARDAEVTAVDAADKADLLRRLGADDVIDFRADDFTDAGRRWDRIIDVATNRSTADYRRALHDGGRFVVVGHYGYDPTWRPWLGNLPGFFAKVAASPFIAEAPPLRLERTERPLRLLSNLIEQGRLTPIVGHTFPLEEVPDAVRLLASGRAEGRIIIEP